MKTNKIVRKIQTFHVFIVVLSGQNRVIFTFRWASETRQNKLSIWYGVYLYYKHYNDICDQRYRFAMLYPICNRMRFIA